MKTAIILVVLCGVAYATPTITGFSYKHKVDDKVFLEKQMNVLRLLKHINQQTYYPDFVEEAQNFSFEKFQGFWTDAKYMTEFMHMWHHKQFLKRGEIFSIYDKEHLYQVITFFKLFYYAKDFDTFFKTAIWARYYMNEGLFLYTFSVALIHRPDCYGLVLPPIYEIYPYYFVNSEIITKAHTLKQIHFEGYEKHDEYAPEHSGKYINKEYFHMNKTFPHHYAYSSSYKFPYLSDVEFKNDEYIIYANYSGWYVKASPEQKMSYFTEDFGMNAFYYYYNLYFPYWMNFKEYKIEFEHRGEYMYFFYQQLMSFYYLNRLSVGLGTVDYFDYDKYIQTGFYPNLLYPNGLQFPVRQEYSYLYHYAGGHVTYPDDVSYFKVMKLKNYERRIMDAIDMGFVYAHDGTKINLHDEKGLEYLANLIEGNYDSVNKAFYGSLCLFFRSILGYSYYPVDKHHLVPSVVEHVETSFRDPVFFQFFKRIFFYFMHYKSTLPKYTYEKLFYKGVRIEDVKFGPLVTYFDWFDVDLSNAVYYSKKEFDTGSFNVKARYQHFNYKNFNYKITLNSDVASKVVVRTFLGPKYDEYGNEISFMHNYYNFYEMDTFYHDMTVGSNVIVRNSNDFFYYVPMRTSYKSLYARVMGALKDGSEFVYGASDLYFGRPHNFVLPMGTYGGKDFQVYVYVCPYQEAATPSKTHEYKFHPFFSFDKHPYGYPLDRPVSMYHFWIPNSFMTNVKIFFKDYKDINSSSKTFY